MRAVSTYMRRNIENSVRVLKIADVNKDRKRRPVRKKLKKMQL